MKIAIGLGKNKNILKALEQFSDEFEIARTNDELMTLYDDPSIDGIIRGSLESNVFCELKKRYSNMFRATVLEINGKDILLTPVGIDEGDSNDSKKCIISECAKFLHHKGIEPRIALISGGRKDDIGRSPKIDKSIKECEDLEKQLKDTYDIKHYYILIEEAIKDNRNVIIAPDGITGNIMFRSLVLVAGIKSKGAVTLKQPKPFIDTSRSQSTEGYVNAIRLMKCTLEKE